MPPEEPLQMERRLIVCPKDPSMQYYAEVCMHRFRAGRLRPWCQLCDRVGRTGCIPVIEAEPSELDRKGA